jgi:hypothetical protein
MKHVALSILALAFAVPAAHAQNKDTSTTESSKSTVQNKDTSTTESNKSTAQSTGQSTDTATTRTPNDRPAAARSRDVGKADDECMCECNGKMIKGMKSHPMGRSPSGMDRSRPAAPTGSATDTSSQPRTGTSETTPTPENPPAAPSTPK